MRSPRGRVRVRSCQRKGALIAGGDHFVGFWTLRVRAKASDRQKLFFFGFEEIFEALDLGVGELLDLVGGALFVVG